MAIQATYLVLSAKSGVFDDGKKWGNLAVSSGVLPKRTTDMQKGLPIMDLTCADDIADKVKKDVPLPCVITFELEELPIKDKVGLCAVSILKVRNEDHPMIIDFLGDLVVGKANYQAADKQKPPREPKS